MTDYFSNLPIIDMATVQDLLDLSPIDETNVFVEIAQVYLEISPGKVKKIQNALENLDFDTITFEAHSLKSSSGSLGAQRLFTLCLELENVAPQKDPIKTRELVSRMNEEYITAERMLHELIAANGRCVR